MPKASVFTLQVMVTSCESVAITKPHRWELAITIFPFYPKSPNLALRSAAEECVGGSAHQQEAVRQLAPGLCDASPACQVPRKGSAPGEMPCVQPGRVLSQQKGRGLKRGGGSSQKLSSWGCISYRKTVQYPTHSVTGTLKNRSH